MLTIKRLGIILFCGTLSVQSSASLMTYTDPGQFNDTMSTFGASVNTIDFDLAPTGSVIANGSQFGGVNFGFSDADGNGFDGMIGSEFSTVSGDNYLGFNDQGSGAFLSGDQITMEFAQPIQALGLYIIASPGDFGFADDAILGAGGALVSNDAIPIDVLADGSETFFLGLLDTDGFDFAELSSICCGFFEFNLDNIMFASFPTTSPPLSVASPSTMVLALFVLPALLSRRRQRYQIAR